MFPISANFKARLNPILCGHEKMIRITSNNRKVYLINAILYQYYMGLNCFNICTAFFKAPLFHCIYKNYSK